MHASFCMPIWFPSVVWSKRKQFLHKTSHNNMDYVEKQSHDFYREALHYRQCRVQSICISDFEIFWYSNFTRRAMICLHGWSRLLCTQRASTFLSQLDMQQATTCSMSTHCTGLTTPAVTIKLFTVTLTGRCCKNSVWKHPFELLVNTVGW